MITRAVIIFIIHYRMLTGLNLIIMTTIKVGDVATYLHRACSLRTSKISSIQIINCQNESEEVNELDLDEKDGRIGFEDGFCCHSGRIVSILGGCNKEGQKKQFSKSFVLGTEAVREYEDAVDNRTKWNVSSLCDCGSVTTGSFDTQAELDAYIQGINDAVGWLEHAEMMTDDEWEIYLAETKEGDDE